MKLRITSDGTVHGLWDDTIDWGALGQVSVRRASHIEFCPRRQRWYVQSGHPPRWWWRVLQWLLQRPCGDILHWARTRGEALAWERGYFAPGGPGWPESGTAHAPPSHT
jgi:hypothetical protein